MLLWVVMRELCESVSALHSLQDDYELERPVNTNKNTVYEAPMYTCNIKAFFEFFDSKVSIINYHLGHLNWWEIYLGKVRM